MHGVRPVITGEDAGTSGVYITVRAVAKQGC
jgi:hypothetical protein